MSSPSPTPPPEERTPAWKKVALGAASAVLGSATWWTLTAVGAHITLTLH